MPASSALTPEAPNAGSAAIKKEKGEGLPEVGASEASSDEKLPGAGGSEVGAISAEQVLRTVEQALERGVVEPRQLTEVIQRAGGVDAEAGGAAPATFMAKVKREVT
jgi:hypothetical protein